MYVYSILFTNSSSLSPLLSSPLLYFSVPLPLPSFPPQFLSTLPPLPLSLSPLSLSPPLLYSSLLSPALRAPLSPYDVTDAHRKDGR